MKILMTLTYYYPHWTGLTGYAQRLAEGLVARGHEVTVLTSHDRPDLSAEDEHNGVRIVRLKSVLRLSRGQVMPAYPAAMWRLLKEHDIVQTHTPMLETAMVGWMAHRLGRKMVMTHHGDLVMPAGLWNRFVQLTVGYLLDRGAAAADVITTHSQDYADHSDYLRPYLSKLEAIYPPVVIPHVQPEAIAAWREELGWTQRRIVGFAGRFVEEKGFDFLLEAVPMVVAQLPDVMFAYAGEHKVVYEGFYERLRPLWEANKDHLMMMGLITDHQKLANFYGMCDVFALPSRTDCFPSVQIEALLCGTPMVATNIPGARQVVRVTEMGLLVEPRNPRALADGLIEVLTHPQRYARSYEQIRSHFDTEQTVTEYERLFERLIAG